MKRKYSGWAKIPLHEFNLLMERIGSRELTVDDHVAIMEAYKNLLGAYTNPPNPEEYKLSIEAHFVDDDFLNNMKTIIVEHVKLKNGKAGN